MPVLGLLGFAALCTGLVLSCKPIARWAHRNKSWLYKFGEKVVIFIITMQIIFTLKTNHTSIGGAAMAEPYDSFVNLASIVDLDLPRVVPFGWWVGRTG